MPSSKFKHSKTVKFLLQNLIFLSPNPRDYPFRNAQYLSFNTSPYLWRRKVLFLPFAISDSQLTFTCFLQKLVQLFYCSCQFIALCLWVISSTLNKSILFKLLLHSKSNYRRKLELTKDYKHTDFWVKY